MNKKQIIGAIVAGVLFTFIGVVSVFSNKIASAFVEKNVATILSGGTSISLPTTSYIGVVEVFGTIQAQTNAGAFAQQAGYKHDDTIEYIDKMMSDNNNKGILLRVDSPGGAVFESEELYQKLMQYKEVTKRPIWGQMEHYAASGGYYVSMPADKIYANPNTTTGSIGVIISTLDLTGLYDKLGVKQINIVSGNNKAADFSNPDQVEIYQSIVDESYNRFVEIVALGRNMDDAKVRELADGRIYSALQAKENGLIDEISLYENTKETIEKESKISNFYSPTIVTSPFASLFASLKEVVPKSEAQILTELSKQEGSGVPMYYAE